MSVKSDISSNYLEEMKSIHGKKPYRGLANVCITGATKDRSIGMAIYEQLHGLKMCDQLVLSKNDVRRPTYPGHYQSFDTLIMCHGVSYLDWFEEAPIAKVREIIDVNLFGTYQLTQEFVRDTINTHYRKRIISIGSMAYRMVLNGSSAYRASKAGSAHLMKCLAWELAPKGYDVYVIHPSNTLDTPMSDETVEGLMRYRNMDRDEAEVYWNDSMVRVESLTKAEIARTIVSIMSAELGYLSGCQIELAGGQR